MRRSVARAVANCCSLGDEELTQALLSANVVHTLVGNVSPSGDSGAPARTAVVHHVPMCDRCRCLLRGAQMMPRFAA